MKISTVLLAAAALFSTACKEKPQPEAQAPPPEAGKEAPVAPALAVPDTFKIALGKVFEGYTRIQSALAQDDLAKAKEALSPLHAVLHMMPKEGLDPAAKAAWDSTDARIMAILHPLAGADSLAAVRAGFMDFSQVLSEAIGKFGTAGEGPIYRFHCPMAKGNQGADWLQRDSTVANPYFGASMLKCGELVRKYKG